MSSGTRVMIVNENSIHYGKFGVIQFLGKSNMYWVDLNGVNFPFYRYELQEI